MTDTLKAKKSLGQHWLQDKNTLKRICDEAKLTATDTVLEIGPGHGTLTELLVERAAKVVAVEFDDNLAKQLPLRVSSDNLEVISQDILGLDFRVLPKNFNVVANIPYYLTSNLIRTLSELPNQPERVVILVQKEVAQRVAAEPGDMSLLSVSAQLYWEVSLGDIVPAELFTPPPKIDSQVLIMQRRSKPLFKDLDEKFFFRVVKAGFSNRRKKLRSSLSSGMRITKPEAANLLNAADISPDKRPQELSLKDWYKLSLTVASAVNSSALPFEKYT